MVILLDFLSLNWCGLEWTPWIKFSDVDDYRKTITQLPGLYRIKPVGIDKLSYLGHTGRSLRERVVGQLIKHTLSDEMPFNDPHTAAPSLWAWRDAEGMEFEFSIAPIDLPKRQREGLECYLLWKYRLEYGESTMCNHGRFHKDYEKSKNRKKGIRGGKLISGINPAWGESYSPLRIKGMPIDRDFMGLNWSHEKPLIIEDIIKVENLPGVYKLYDPSNETLLYFGESKNLKNRLISHSRKKWEEIVFFSYVSFKLDIEKYKLKEIENDLIGGYYELTRDVPKYQFINFK